MKKNKKMSFVYMLLSIGSYPAIFALIISTFISVTQMTNALENGVFEKLNVAAESLANYYEYDIVGGELEYEEDYVDSLLGQNIELTVFKDDTRFMTSIYKDGTTERNIGTTADPTIYAEVKNGNIVQKDKVVIGGEKYYVAYRPMYDQDGKFWGMAFAGAKQVEVEKAVNKAKLLLIVSAILIVAFSVCVIVYLTLKIKKTMEEAVKQLNVLSSGDMTQSIDAQSSIKEINDIIVASKTLQEQLNNSIKSVKESASLTSEAVIEVDNKTAHNVESVSQISEAIDEVSTTSQTVSSSAINLAMKTNDLENNIDDLSKNVDILSLSSEEIKKANNEASEYMETVLNSSEQSVVAVDGITEDIHKTNDAIEEIKSAVGMIEEIASETKLLSLNASIEAAHAGEAGKGFSVVAENIKILAESSANNVKKISEIINKIVDIASQTVKNSEEVKNIIDNEQKYIVETQNKFKILSDNVDNSIIQIQDIANKTNDLNVIKKEITEETESLSAISQELGASAEEVSASCTTVLSACEETMTKTEEMKDINNSLTEAISFFKI